MAALAVAFIPLETVTEFKHINFFWYTISGNPQKKLTIYLWRVLILPGIDEEIMIVSILMIPSLKSNFVNHFSYTSTIGISVNMIL
ncbi:hypothetical protein SD81_005345 [Tolypothrix campylonemoides VB511288]|nr:hypothetical protein SD81_005345 [Tolypothrix campylonemoides VB511288]